MSNVSTQIKNWSAVAASNQPDGTDSATIQGDLQAIQAAVRNLYSQDTIASATTCDLGTKDAESLTISGITTITALGTVSAGIVKRVLFSGELVLTYNATSLILPGLSNITTVAGDTAELESLGAGNWRCNWYQRASGFASISGATFTGPINEARGTVTMHATTMDLWAQPNTIDGTGSAVTITAIANAPQAGARRTLYPIVATVITNGATFAVDGAANYTTAAGDAIEFEAVTTSTYKVHITKKDGTAVAGGTQTSKIQSVGYSLAANALTLTLEPTSLDFRSTTLTTGAPTTVTNAAQINTTISSGSTGGTVSAVQSDIIILAINNAGTMELAWCNAAGGINLDETTLISTTAEGGAGAADSATVIYSTTARSNVAFRVVGVFRSIQTTAGTWAQTPSLVQGIGGQALSAMSSLGYGQTWQALTGSRAFSTTYYNTTGKPIQLVMSTTTQASVTLSVNGSAIATSIWGISAIIPIASSYSIASGGIINTWSEFR